MSSVIKVENLSKQYRLGTVGTGALAHDINRWWFRVRGKEDPYLKIGEANDRTQKGSSEYVWALRDINFDVQYGEVLGIIGRNGAGKSTLLKILSRTTAPTTGSVKIKGRVASLLEVGTGFHPELTGRENIFLNGAILGMTKKEIASKFDAIVDFAGVERYIDTPVKRYSSGMYVRLAFAVAAHLEPEILIVDEVLAVGDAEFQKKCLGKMKDVSEKDGRTVFFVSHNMEAVIKLCSRAFFLNDGKISEIGETGYVINKYLNYFSNQSDILDLKRAKRDSFSRQNAKFCSIRILSKFNGWKVEYKSNLEFEISIELFCALENLEVGIAIFTSTDFEIVSSLSTDYKLITDFKVGMNMLRYKFEDLHLLPGTYRFSLGLRSERGFEDYLQSVGNFEIIISPESAKDKTETRKGIIIPKISIK